MTQSARFRPKLFTWSFPCLAARRGRASVQIVRPRPASIRVGCGTAGRPRQAGPARCQRLAARRDQATGPAIGAKRIAWRAAVTASG